MGIRASLTNADLRCLTVASCVFWGDLYGCEGPEGNPQPPVSQLADFVRARKLFAYGEIRDYWDHPNCLGWVRPGDEWHDGCAYSLALFAWILRYFQARL